LPTLAQCMSEAYSQSACGIQRLPACRSQLSTYYHRKSGELTTSPSHLSKWIIEPENQGMAHPGDVGLANLIPFDTSRMQFSNASAPDRYYEATFSGNFDRVRNIGTIPVIPTGAAITSCQDYVFKKYYDYSMFEGAALGCGVNDDC